MKESHRVSHTPHRYNRIMELNQNEERINLLRKFMIIHEQQFGEQKNHVKHFAIIVQDDC